MSKPREASKDGTRKFTLKPTGLSIRNKNGGGWVAYAEGIACNKGQERV